MGKYIDLTNKRFGRLIVLQRLSVNKNGTYLWLCVCDCGKQKSLQGNHLRNGATNSCGCLHSEMLVRRNKTLLATHNLTNGSEYKSYHGAKQRCENPKAQGYENYGGRGIQFKFSSFEEFYEYLGPRPKGLTLERPDVNGHYEKGNVIWATYSVQNKNQRRWLCRKP